MDMNSVNLYREEKDHQMRYGHLNKQDREDMAYHRRNIMYPDKNDKNNHSPNQDHLEGM